MPQLVVLPVVNKADISNTMAWLKDVPSSGQAIVIIAFRMPVVVEAIFVAICNNYYYCGEQVAL